MSFTASIQISQGATCDSFVITDSSSYVSEPKSGFSARQLIIYKSDGSVFRGTGQSTDQIDFGYGLYPSDSITISGLDKDYAFSVMMVVTPNTPQLGSTYSVTTKFALVCYTMQAFYDRAKKQSVNPRYEANRDYVVDTHRIFVEKESAVKAAANSDIVSAQMALDRAKYIIDTNKIPY